MATHSVAEAFDAVWTGRCDRHGGAHPAVCGAVDDLDEYEKSAVGIETWYLGA